MREVYETLSAECELVVTLCDIYGGTPFNVTTRCLLNGMNMVAYTGLSMPVAVELLLTRDGLDSADAVRAQLTAAHAGAQQEIKAPAPAVEADEDDLDLGSLARRFEWRSPLSPEWAPRSSRAFVNGTEGTCKRKGEHHGTQTRRHR